MSRSNYWSMCSSFVKLILNLKVQLEKLTNKLLWHPEDINRFGSQVLTDSSAFLQRKHLKHFFSFGN